ncbi:MAG: DUF6261 family protein [Tannerellaceae bacterium]|jgi:hypothetical protein|nr:DUF6261 family protein [Tannerellaceae bacterium]
MKIIQKFANLVRRFRNADHYGFYQAIIEFVEPFENLLGEAIKTWLAFKADFGHEDTVFKRSARSTETPEIQAADAERMDAFQVIKLSVDASSHSKNPTEHAAALGLAFVLNNFKQIPHTSMTQAQALIYNLLQDLRLPAYAPHVTTLGLGDAVNTLEAANDAFRIAFAQREQSLGNALRQGNMKSARPRTDKGFTAVAEVVNALYAIAKLNGNAAAMATFTTIIDGINNIIHYYENLYAHIGGGGSSDLEEDNDDDDADLTPTFAITAQATLGTGASGNRMSLLAADPEAFAAALHPSAEGSVMRIFNAEKDVFENFPVVGFLLGEDGETPTGLIVESFSSKVTFDRPFAGVFDPQTVEILKDDLLLALLTDVLYPATIIDA